MPTHTTHTLRFSKSWDTSSSPGIFIDHESRQSRVHITWKYSRPALGFGFMVCGSCCMVCGLWFVVYGLWFMVYGPWSMVYGLWFMVWVWGLV